MLDFKKKLADSKIERKINPVEIYDTLDRSSETGPLRPAQKRILEQWFNERKIDKDIILKLHTGQGKTLIGLLILQSNLNQEKGPGLYICPNKHLSLQTSEQARKFGFQHILLDEGDIPTEFLEGKKILITHVQKVFNGLTKFGLNRQSIKAGTVVLDDSHACIDSIRDSFTITIGNTDAPYIDLIELFEEDIRAQGLGTYQEIRQEEFDSILPVPYWAWIDKLDLTMTILSKNRTIDSIKYKWPLLKDTLKNCHCVFSGRKIEISPYVNPINQFGTFADATQRILMSATTFDDSFFNKGLGLSVESIKNPLKDAKEKWSGEKIIIIPSLINETLDRIKIINELAVPVTKRKLGMVVLVPSFNKTSLYKRQGCTIAVSDTIYSEVKNLKDGAYSIPLVIANRYDGIDLPDESCRILIIDSKPHSENLNDSYEEICRPHSDLINIRLAQKIEQGMGRSVRGEKDFSVIILLGNDLINFIRGVKTQGYFSDQTRNKLRSD